jgi:restriction endonuclease S subunit
MDASQYKDYVLTEIDAEIDAIEAKLAKTRQIKQGRMQELLTGRIRLPIDAKRVDNINLVQST